MTIYPLISLGVISFINKGTELQVIPTTIPTTKRPKTKNIIEPTKVKVIPHSAIASEIIIAPLRPNVKFT